MNTTKITLIIALLATLAVPCFITGILFDHWFPYHLTGKQFLLFYGLHLLTGMIALGINTAGKLTGRKLPGYYLILTLTIALSRMIQGLHNHKPILFLLLLTIINIILICVCGLKKARTEKVI